MVHAHIFNNIVFNSEVGNFPITFVPEIRHHSYKESHKTGFWICQNDDTVQWLKCVVASIVIPSKTGPPSKFRAWNSGEGMSDMRIGIFYMEGANMFVDPINFVRNFKMANPVDGIIVFKGNNPNPKNSNSMEYR